LREFSHAVGATGVGRSQSASDGPDRGGARAFSPPARFPILEFVLDGLTFLEIVKPSTFHRRMVEKDVSAIASDEPKTTIGDHFLDDTLRHGNRSSLT
jgi:hypothetical protein